MKIKKLPTTWTQHNEKLRKKKNYLNTLILAVRTNAHYVL